MAITGSPAVIVQEQDLSSYVSADSVTTGAVVGAFEWGPVEAITKITSEGKLIQFFGYPRDWNYKDWFTARNFLHYSSSLAVVRVVSEDSKNAYYAYNSASDEKERYYYTTGNIVSKNYNNFEFDLKNIKTLEIDETVKDEVEPKTAFIARYPGNLGNKIRVAMINKLGLDAQDARIANGEEVTLNGVTSLISRPLQDDEVVVAVYMSNEAENDEDTILEFGIFSTVDGSTDVTGYGNYVFKYFNNNSNWIYIPEGSINFNEKVNFDVILENGYSSEDTPSLYSYTNGWNLFSNEETSDTEVQLLMQGGANIEVGNYIIDLAETRKDCLACVSPMIDEVVNTLTPVDNIVKGSASSYRGSSYAFMDGNYKYQYDSYNDVYRWLPLNGDIAGIMAQLDDEEEPWMSPGGKQIKNCVKLAFHPSKAERDDLFAANVNPVTNFRSEGNILWGDWTRKNTTSFNFVGVRRLFLHVERAIKEYARNVMWKQNDEITETTFIQTVEPFLMDIQGGRGIQEFKVYAGASVTSPDEMDKGIFRAKILIKPVRSIRYVVLVFTAVRSDMSIEEIVQ